MASSGYLTEGGGLLRILYLGIRNSIEELDDASFTKSNRVGNAQLVANTTVADVEKLGVLAGSVCVSTGEGVVGAGAGPTDAALGLFVNDAAGNAFESTSAAASGKGVYVHGSGVYECGVYETHDQAGSGSIMAAYTFGKELYCSQNGFLTVEEGLSGGGATAGDLVMGVITKAPTAADPVMRLTLKFYKV
ncbi:hypothetical protein N9948_02150 [bacterium]|nr:hypothetical protein [bacterium]